MVTSVQSVEDGGIDVVLIGAGGIAAPAAMALVAAGVKSLRIVDDDQVELSNLHRQILFSDADIGTSKLEALKRALLARAPDLSIEVRSGRCLPETAFDVFAGASVVLDATDNFASRFLIADAARILGVAVVHAAAVQWRATVMAVSEAGQPCYRCLFEDLPNGPAPDCATAGVVGPVCGVAGAIGADLAVRILRGDHSAYGAITTYDGRTDRLRRVAVGSRPDCPLCGQSPLFRTIDRARYLAPPASVGLSHGTSSGALDCGAVATTVRLAAEDH